MQVFVYKAQNAFTCCYNVSQDKRFCICYTDFSQNVMNFNEEKNGSPVDYFSYLESNFCALNCRTF